MMKLNNFSFSEGSGYGKYTTYINGVAAEGRFEGTYTSTTAHFTKKLTTINNFINVHVYNGIPFKIRIEGLTDNRKFYIRETGGTAKYLDNGQHEVTLTYKSSTTSILEPMGVTGDIGDIDVTVEFIPDYPDALVFDGVDDYGINENMPILTDYTVIIKRIFISKKVTYTISKTRGNFGAFGLESPQPLTKSFGADTINIKINFDGISWQTKNSYNQQPINSGNNVDSDFICLGSVRSDFRTYFHGAIYSAYLFDRSLDEQEIKSFIRKYIDPNYVLPSEQTT